MTDLFRGHREILESSAIDLDVALEAGIRSAIDRRDLPAELSTWKDTLPGVLFAQTGPDGRVVHQLRPDAPLRIPGEERPRLRVGAELREGGAGLGAFELQPLPPVGEQPALQPGELGPRQRARDRPFEQRLITPTVLIGNNAMQQMAFATFNAEHRHADAGARQAECSVEHMCSESAHYS